MEKKGRGGKKKETKDIMIKKNESKNHIPNFFFLFRINIQICYQSTLSSAFPATGATLFFPERSHFQNFLRIAYILPYLRLSAFTAKEKDSIFLHNISCHVNFHLGTKSLVLCHFLSFLCFHF